MKILAGLLLMVMVYAISFGMMVYGWGIPPENLTVIITGYVFTFALNIISIGLMSD